MKRKNKENKRIMLVLIVVLVSLIIFAAAFVIINQTGSHTGKYLEESVGQCGDSKKIVWEEDREENMDIFMCEICENNEFNNCGTYDEKFRITFSDKKDIYPYIDKNKLVWVRVFDSWENIKMQLLMCDLSKGYSRCEDNKVVIKEIRKNQNYLLSNPKISGSKLVVKFNDYTLNFCNLDISEGEKGFCSNDFGIDEFVTTGWPKFFSDVVFKGDYLAYKLVEENYNSTLRLCKVSETDFRDCTDIAIEGLPFKTDYPADVDNGFVVFDAGEIGKKNIYYSNGDNTVLVAENIPLYGSPQIRYPYIVFRLTPLSLGPVCFCNMENNGQDTGCLASDAKSCIFRNKYSQHYPAMIESEFQDYLIIKDLDNFQGKTEFIPLSALTGD